MKKIICIIVSCLMIAALSSCKKETVPFLSTLEGTSWSDAEADGDASAAIVLSFYDTYSFITIAYQEDGEESVTMQFEYDYTYDAVGGRANMAAAGGTLYEGDTQTSFEELGISFDNTSATLNEGNESINVTLPMDGGSVTLYPR